MATTKKKSQTAIIRDLTAELAAARQLIDKLTKERDSEKSNKDSFYKRMEEAQREIEQTHALLDVLPGVGRKSEPGDYGGFTVYTLSTRIAAFLAKR